MEERTFPYFALYPGDFQSSKTWPGMPAAAKGILIELLMHSWISDALPIDEEELMRRARATPKEWKEFEKYLDIVLPIRVDKRINVRLEKERDKVRSFSNLQSIKGSQGGRPKGSKSDPSKKAQDKSQKSRGLSESSGLESSGKATEKPGLFENPDIEKPGLNHGEAGVKPTQNSELISKNTDNPLNPQGGMSEISSLAEFMTEFKKRYPSRLGGQNWPAVEKKLRTAKSLWPKILEGVSAFAKQQREIGTEKKYIPMASSWVTQRRWEDDYSDAPTVETEPNNETNEPVSGVDFVYGFDPVTDMAVKLIPGTQNRFDEAAWREKR